jgi:uncharacterized protein (DUF1800 family)
MPFTGIGGDIQSDERTDKLLQSVVDGLIVQQQLSLREKMVLFWHNHFVTEPMP